MSGLVFLVFAAILARTESQTLSTSVVDAYTALVPVGIKCRTDPIKGLSCNADYPDQCREQWNFPNPCTPQNLNLKVPRFVHPFDRTKFLMCGDMGKLYVVKCPEHEVFHEGCNECVGNGAGFDASCEVPLAPLVDNPCTQESIMANKLFFPFPGDLSKFIHCDVWGKAWQRTCTVGEVWSQYEVTCVLPSVLNPCNRPSTDIDFLYNHPCDPYKYIRCDMHGVAFEVVCPSSTVFVEATQTCQSMSSLSYQPENLCGNYRFGFKIYRDVAVQQVPLSGSMPIPIDRAGTVTATGQLDTNVAAAGNEFNVIMDAWKASVVSGRTRSDGMGVGGRITSGAGMTSSGMETGAGLTSGETGMGTGTGMSSGELRIGTGRIMTSGGVETGAGMNSGGTGMGTGTGMASGGMGTDTGMASGGMGTDTGMASGGMGTDTGMASGGMGTDTGMAFGGMGTDTVMASGGMGTDTGKASGGMGTGTEMKSSEMITGNWITSGGMGRNEGIISGGMGTNAGMTSGGMGTHAGMTSGGMGTHAGMTSGGMGTNAGITSGAGMNSAGMGAGTGTSSGGTGMTSNTFWMRTGTGSTSGGMGTGAGMSSGGMAVGDRVNFGEMGTGTGITSDGIGRGTGTGMTSSKFWMRTGTGSTSGGMGTGADINSGARMNSGGMAVGERMTFGEMGENAGMTSGTVSTGGSINSATVIDTGAGTQRIHASQLKEYTFSTVRWAEPCTKDNVLNSRFHFKLKDYPHFYLQCDAHGMMYKMPCSTDGVKADWFDVYTSTCVDGPVHIPSEQLKGGGNDMRFKGLINKQGFEMPQQGKDENHKRILLIKKNTPTSNTP